MTPSPGVWEPPLGFKFFLAFIGRRFHISAMSIVAAVPLPAQPLAGQMPEAIEHVEHDDARVVLTRDGHPVAAIVPLHDLRALEELDDAEDAYLSRVAAEAVAEWEAEGCPPGISHEELLARYGITPDAE